MEATCDLYIINPRLERYRLAASKNPDDAVLRALAGLLMVTVAGESVMLVSGAPGEERNLKQKREQRTSCLASRDRGNEEAA